MLQIRDPIHGYITLEGMYANIVNTPEFQRLRAIEQGSFRPVFPGARHDRFIHSLGTYHLANKFADRFFENLEKDVKIKVSAAERKLLKTTFCYAALLHDIGHAPYSHTTEGFFLEPQDPARPGTPLIWSQLCDAIAKEAPQEANLFRNARKRYIGAPHEIVSATILVSDQVYFIPPKERKNVDLALAARMVIGYTYLPGDLSAFPGIPDSPNPPAPGSIQDLGIRNCLIQLLNSSILDVDRLDYLGRDTQMSGFFNAPLDLDCLASSVTAVALENGMLAPAYQVTALSVFDLMFQAKLSHDAWVLASPAGPYDAALLAHCIRQLNNKIHPDYMETVFSRDALCRDGVSLYGSVYRLLSDIDIGADLKAQSGGAFDELHTRQLGRRRVAAWRSYYDFHHIFNDPASGVTPEKVHAFFQPLLNYLDKQHIFIFDFKAYKSIPGTADPALLRAADFLHGFLRNLTSDPDKKDNYNVVLLERTNNFTTKLDPAQIRIVFPEKSLPLRAGRYTYSTYADLTGVSSDDVRSRKYFYLYRHGGLGYKQLEKLRKALANVL